MICEIARTSASISYGSQSGYVWRNLMAPNEISGNFSFLSLFSEGCDYDGLKDCSKACNYIEKVWGSDAAIFTLHNCAVRNIHENKSSGNILMSILGLLNHRRNVLQRRQQRCGGIVPRPPERVQNLASKLLESGGRAFDLYRRLLRYCRPK